MSLQNHTILIVDSATISFVADLKKALEECFADVLIAPDPTIASTYLKRFEFSAVLIGQVGNAAEGYQRLVKELGGIPFRLYDPAEGMPAIVRAVTHMLGCQDTCK